MKAEMRHITFEQWEEFEKRFPSAYSFLNSCSILSETTSLLRERNCERFLKRRYHFLGRWKRNRLAELIRVMRTRVKLGIANEAERELYPY